MNTGTIEFVETTEKVEVSDENICHIFVYTESDGSYYACSGWSQTGHKVFCGAKTSQALGWYTMSDALSTICACGYKRCQDCLDAFLLFSQLS